MQYYAAHLIVAAAVLAAVALVLAAVAALHVGKATVLALILAAVLALHVGKAALGGGSLLGAAGRPRLYSGVVRLLVVGLCHGACLALALGNGLRLGAALLEECELTLLGDEASVT